MSASPTEPVPADQAADQGALVIGEALVDLIRRPGRPEDARVGGSPLNVAVGLARLGVPAVLATRIGTDAHGEAVERHLAGNGVGLVDGSVVPGPTSTARATIAEDGSASYDFDIAWTLEAAPRRTPALVHTGSIGAVLAPGTDAVQAAIVGLRPTATVSYDPNVRPQLMGERDVVRAQVEALVGTADVVKASDEDAAWLHPGLTVPEVARRWLALGPALVVITRGGEGAHAVTRSGSVDVIAEPTEVADTIGAGDSFMAGLLAALVDAGLVGRAQEQRLRAIGAEELLGVLEFAASCAAVTVSRPGADPPRRAELAG